MKIKSACKSTSPAPGLTAMLGSHIQPTPPAQGTPFHGHGLMVANTEIPCQKYFKLGTCGWRTRQTSHVPCYQHCHHSPKWHISAPPWWTLSAFSQASLAFQRREDPAFGSTCCKSVTYQENSHCVGKCRLSPELLNLGGVGGRDIQDCYMKGQPRRKTDDTGYF